jgi:ribonuclease Z
MATTVTITGTGTPQLAPDRAGPGALVEFGDIRLQFDVGRGTVMRLAATGVEPSQVSAVFLTHYHSDHLIGLEELVLTRWVLDRDDSAEPLPIVAPNGATVRFCERMLDHWQDDLAVRSAHNHRAPEPRLEIIGFDTPPEPVEVWRSGDVRVIAGQVRHEPVEGAVGFRIETPDGVVAISGDTLVCDELRQLYEGADVIVQEAMRMDVINQRPPDLRFIADYHSDTRLIGALAEELAIPTVMLTHLIPIPGTQEEEQEFIDEVREGGYRGEVLVCKDLDSVDL